MAVDVGSLPCPWVLRVGRPDEYATFAHLFTELGLEEPPPPESMWVEDMASRTFFAEGPEGVVAGYSTTDVLGAWGYVGQLVVAPFARRQGLGRWLMRHAAQRFRAQGCQSWALNVKRDNVAALGLYTAMGMRRERWGTNLKVTRALLAQLPPVPAGLVVVPLAPSHCEPLTEMWRMLPGKLARFGTQMGHRLLRLAPEHGGESTSPLGLMDFRAGSRLLFPFFAASLGHARALMEAAFSLLGEAHPVLNVVVTDDTPLEQRLRELGAEVSLETYELRGTLPDLASARAP
ncbi:acetyltransferase [Myxococcus stipitatus DSM 14675]|uniref:Acetyltransferase n=1 Tax=Myxococcus stipitatus (strain DSM 14675 / JCM 12634 / Mx s8) TaxID=1278073 RepID=L7U3R2_MYXSD|nr:GNAT family N-acetyltransferase [Myxococcus stipitatus]AGC42470.1 acetyltransferase [Myxococcus stipitatus DSM 14675]